MWFFLHKKILPPFGKTCNIPDSTVDLSWNSESTIDIIRDLTPFDKLVKSMFTLIYSFLGFQRVSLRWRVPKIDASRKWPATPPKRWLQAAERHRLMAMEEYARTWQRMTAFALQLRQGQGGKQRHGAAWFRCKACARERTRPFTHVDT
jgi:hypothetical protein